MLLPCAKADIWFDNGTGTLDFGTAANWSTDQLPSAAGVGRGFLGGNFDVIFGGTMTTVGELQVGTDAAPYGTAGIPGGPARLTLNSGANLTIPSNLIVGQGRGDTDNSGTVTVKSGASLTLSGSSRRIFLGFFDNDPAGSTTGNLVVDGGTVSMTNGLAVVGGWDSNNGDNYGRGNLTVSSGQMTVQSLAVGWNGGVGHVLLSGGTLSTTSGYFGMGLGYNGRHGFGIFEMTGGEFTAGADFTVHESSDDTASSSRFAQSGGTATLKGTTNVVGRSAKGTGFLDLSGNAILNLRGTGDLKVGGVNPGATGRLTIAGSAALDIAAPYALALATTQNASGIVVQAGGTVSIGSTSTLGLWMGSGGAGTQASYELNGGTLEVPLITVDGGAGARSFSFNGGLLKANRSFTVAAPTNFSSTVQAGGARIDTAGKNVTWQGALLAGDGTGGLTKSGAGVLSLSGFNTYRGPTVVEAGRLALARPYLDDSSQLVLGTAANSGAEIELNFADMDGIGSLVIDGVPMPPGIYTAANTPAHIRGPGKLQVPSPYAAWAASRGLDGSVGKESSFSADPDGDGVPNGLEWIIDGNPIAGNGPDTRPEMSLTDPDLLLRLRREKSTTGMVDLLLQWSTDLQLWHDVPIGDLSSAPDANGVAVTIGGLDASHDQVTVAIPTENEENGRMFVRLKAPVPQGVDENSYQGPPITLESLVAEMTSYDSIARWPSPEFVCRQASSYDRRSISPNEDGWFANDDFSGRVRIETNSGRREEVLMDEEGPGSIVRFWVTTDSTNAGGGVLRIYLDNDPNPALTFSAFDLLSGDMNLPTPFATAHPGYTANGFGGNTMMLPIPYAGRCKVTWEEKSSGKRYYQINYRRYPRGTPVQTFTSAILDAARPALSTAAGRLLSPPTSPAGALASTTFSLAPNEEKVIDLPSGENAVRFLKFLLNSTGGDATDHALRSLVVKMSFDGEQTVWCPVSDFFGSAVGVNVMANWYNTVQADGTMISCWVMPYQQSGRITLHNFGSASVGGTIEHYTTPWEWDNRSMHFHTAWNYEAGMRTPPIADWNFVSLAGKGVYAGDTLALYNEAATWYGEGDEKIWVDGEAFPSHFGTGTEDYYNYSFAPRMNMQTPWANLTRVDQAATLGHNVMSRSRNLDGIPFTKGLDFDIELISWVPTRLLYAATSRWYAFPGGETNVEPDPADATAYIPTLADAQQPPPAFEGVLDAELATVVGTSAGLARETQNMQGFGFDVWSRGEQLLGRGTKVGDFITLSIPAPDNAPHEIRVALTQAADFGRLSFTVNGQASAAVFDGYATSVLHAADLSLGTFTPVDGKYEIRVQVSGTNPSATGNRYYFGIDYFRIP
jgi:autotransporter-associated beta strand protein